MQPGISLSPFAIGNTDVG